MSEKQSVVIYQPVKNAMQSGKAGIAKYWLIEGAKPEEDPRFIDPLMGWTGSTDTKKQVKLRFTTQEEAVAYAERQGHHYTIKEPETRKIIKRAYADNFKYKATC